MVPTEVAGVVGHSVGAQPHGSFKPAAIRSYKRGAVLPAAVHPNLGGCSSQRHSRRLRGGRAPTPEMPEGLAPF